MNATPAGTKPPDDKSLLTGALGGLPALAGEFTDARDGSRWVMLVNCDRTKSAAGQPQWRKPPKKVQMLSPYLGELVAYEGEQVFLAPGQGALLKVE
jgi:hypothetical protein